jgi:calretinin
MEAAKKRVNVERAQNFMRQYRDPESRELKKLSANQFMDVWSHYDKDGKHKYFILYCRQIHSHS